MRESLEKPNPFQFRILTLMVVVALVAAWLGALRLGTGEITPRYAVLFVLVAAAGRLARPNGRPHAFWQGFVLTCAMHLFSSSGLVDTKSLTQFLARHGRWIGSAIPYDDLARAAWPVVVVGFSVFGGVLSVMTHGMLGKKPERAQD